MGQREHVSSSENIVDVSKIGRRHWRPHRGRPAAAQVDRSHRRGFRLALVFIVVIPGCIWLHYNPGPLDRF